MTTDRQPIRRSLCLTALVAGAALLTACGSTTPSQTASASATSPTGASTATPLATNSPVDGATPAAPGQDQPGQSGPRARSTGDYGQALIGAWTAGDTAAIADLASASAAATLKAAKAPTGLLLTVCEDNLCSWSNEAGKRVTLTFDTAKVSAGGAQAVTAAKLS